MATGQESTDSSSKTGGFEANKECDLCGSTTPVKYCPECEFTLCSICSKGHGKIQSTKDHALLDICVTRKNISYAKSGDGESGPSSCINHPKSSLEFYCEQCTMLICDVCRPNHDAHTVKSIENNLKMYQNICTQHIKSLLDKTYDLEEHKSLINGVFSGYDKAIQMVNKWEEELVRLVQECSSTLRADLEKARKELENAINDDEKCLTEMNEEVEKKLSKLYSIRKVTNVDIFSHELAASQQLLEKVKDFMENNLPLITIQTVDNLLPTLTHLPTVKKEIVGLMTPGKAAHGTTTVHSTYPVPNIKSLTKQFQISIPMPRSSVGYGINKSFYKDNHLLIHGTGTEDIRLFDISNKTFTKRKSKCGIWVFICTDVGEYVAIDDTKNTLNLLNSNFKVTRSLTAGPNIEFEGVAYVSNNEFLLLERVTVSSGARPMAYMSLVEIKNNLFNVGKRMCCDYDVTAPVVATSKDKKHVFVSSECQIHKTSLDDWSTKSTDMTNWLDCIWSLCAADGHLLVGDDVGNIHVLDNNLKYKTIILTVPDTATDMAISNGYLVVTTVNNTIILYK